jgi:hypothetical protein
MVMIYRLEGIYKQVVVAQVTYYPEIGLKGLRKSQQNIQSS